MTVQTAIPVNPIYSFVGLREQEMSPHALLDQIEKGIPVAGVRKLAEFLFPDAGNRAVEHLVSRSTIERIKRSRTPRFSRAATEQIYPVIKVTAKAMELYPGEPEKAVRFLQKPHAMLGGLAPLELARRSGAGADMVMDMFNRIQAGLAV
ncbi:antitoxin Xre/MbcA/ParS toxin-binding domain-containing protein [Thalassospira marina]|nr:antitoxin Xre/MbcA/ParS toxin-binding domain-containing protein [Thalassospira marina]